MLRFVPVRVIAPVLRAALNLRAALYQTFDTSPAEIIRHFIVSNSCFNASVSTATLIRSVRGGPKISLYVCLCSRFYEGPCHWFWGRIVLILFPIWPRTYTVFREVCVHRLATLSTALETTLCQFHSQFDHWLVSDTTQFTGTRYFSCSYTAACVRDRTPQAYGEAPSCQDQIYKVCKATVPCNLWEDFVNIFARPIIPLWLEVYVLKCQVFRYFALTVVEIMKNDVS